jgi:hypothetical protein
VSYAKGPEGPTRGANRGKVHALGLAKENRGKTRRKVGASSPSSPLPLKAPLQGAQIELRIIINRQHMRNIC